MLSILLKAESLRIEETLIRTMSAWANRDLARGWRALYHLVEQKRIAMNAIGRLMNQQTSRALRAWELSVRRQSGAAMMQDAREVLMYQSIRRLQKQEEARAFNKWSETSKARAKLRLMIRRAQMRYERIALEMLLLNVAHVASAKCAISRLIHQGMTKGFLTWYEVVSNRAEALSRAKRSLSKFVNHSINRAFNMWMEVATQRLKVRRLAGRIGRQGESKALNRWAEVAAARLERITLLKRAADSLFGRGVGKALMRWRSETRWSRRSSLQIARFWLHAEMAFFERWKHNVREFIAPARASQKAGRVMGSFFGCRKGFRAIKAYATATKLELEWALEPKRMSADADAFIKDLSWQQQQSAHVSLAVWTGVRRLLGRWKARTQKALLDEYARECADDHRVYAQAATMVALLRWWRYKAIARVEKQKVEAEAFGEGGGFSRASSTPSPAADAPAYGSRRRSSGAGSVRFASPPTHPGRWVQDQDRWSEVPPRVQEMSEAETPPPSRYSWRRG